MDNSSTTIFSENISNPCAMNEGVENFGCPFLQQVLQPLQPEHYPSRAEFCDWIIQNYQHVI
jgi:hypothetical protein